MWVRDHHFGVIYSTFLREDRMVLFNNIKKIFIRKAFDIHFDTNESDNKLILLERRFDVIFTSFSSSIKVRYFFLIVHMTNLSNT